ncbi:MAG: VanZ family protein [Bacillota bacterium]|nr:VanZ family protein [Bacillota bacterium]
MVKRIFKWSLVIAFMTAIFIFSSEKAADSEQKSQFVIYILNILGINVESAFGSLADFAVRKAAHFTEYFILYLLIFNALYNDFNKKTSLLFSLFFVFLYASTDEYHQLFVPGRSGKFRDVLIDTSGGALGLLIMGFLSHRKKVSKEN